MRRTQLIIDGTSVDVDQDVSIPLTFAISDIKNPDQRLGSHSKTVKLVGSPAVNRVLTHVFDVNYEIQNVSTTNFNPDFNPNLKATAVVLVDSIEQFRGYMRLRSIERSRQNLDRIIYNVELFGELGNLIQLMGDAKLTDLDFSEYDHTYNRTNQKASWTVNSAQGYYYPMIQYGLNDGVNWKLEHFFPAIYAKQYWDKIFAYIGCYYTGFPTSTPFTEFVVPFTGESFKLSQSQVTNRKFNATTTGTITATGTTNFGSLAEPVVFDSEVSDPDAQYNPATGYFTCVDAGFYEFVFNGEFRWGASGGNVTNVGNQSAYLNVLVYHQRGATVTLLNGAAVHNDFSSILSGNFTTAVTFTYTSDTVELEAGDLVWIKLLPVCSPASGSANLVFELASGADFYNTVSNPQIVEGNTLSLNEAIPTDVRMADFFLSIVKEFNLMVEPVRTMPNTYTIETAPVFYSGGTTRDWTDKVDTSKSIELYPMGALDFRRLILKRTDSDDYFNKRYRDEWAETYGMKKYDVSTDFLKNVNEFESIFIDTPLVGRNSDDRVYPEIYTLDSSGNPKPTSSGIRLLYAGGAVSTGYAWNYLTDGGTYSETTYPYAGHLDSVSSPTFDLCFSVPKRVYYSVTNYTDGNLWNRYHSRFITEITDKNSKILTAFFYLKPKDILQLSFRDPIYLDVLGINGYYRLQKVIDYDPTKEGTTKCELLKVKAASSFVASTYSVANFGDSLYGLANGFTGRPSVVNGSSVGVGRDVISTERNSGSIVGGERNRLGAGAERIGIIGSSGVDVYPEVKGAVAIGTNDVTLDEDGVIWIGGQRYNSNDREYTVTTSQTITSNGIYNCSGTLTLTLSASVLNHGEIIQVYNLGTGTVTIAGGGLNIRSSTGGSSATYTSSSQYDSITLEYKTSYYIVR